MATKIKTNRRYTEYTLVGINTLNDQICVLCRGCFTAVMERLVLERWRAMFYDLHVDPMS